METFSLYIVLVVIVFFITLLFLLKPVFNRHSHNISKSKKILNKIQEFKFPGEKINYLRTIDPFVFEELILNAFEDWGYNIERNKKYTGDGGVDGIIYSKKGTKILIQAKRYSGSMLIGVGIIKTVNFTE